MTNGEGNTAMRISTFGRHIREGARNVIRNGWMTFASVSAIAISLFILGLFMLLAINVSFIATQVEKQVEIRVFLDVNIKPDQTNALQLAIQNIPEVDTVKYVSKAEGLKMLRDKMGEGGKAYLEGLDGDENPLNDSFTVEVKEPQNVGQVATKIEQLNKTRPSKPIIKVSYGQGTVETMFKVTKVLRYIGIGMVVSLGVTAMFLISNTIKLTILARSREIKIMKMVGATNSFIRWPFFIEGALLGLVGSILPSGLLAWGYWEFLNSDFVHLDTFWIKFKPFDEIMISMGFILVLIGTIIGVWGSTLSVRKFLRV